MLQKRFLVIFLIVFLITLGCVWAEDNTTQALEKKSPEVKSFDDIQNAINQVSENDTVELEGTYTGQGKEITIDKPVTITSKNGATLDANEKSGIFSISNVTVCLNNLNFINSKSESAISTHGKLTVENCNFTKNGGFHSDASYIPYDYEYIPYTPCAGAIRSYDDIMIDNCRFDKNYVTFESYDHEYFEYYYSTDRIAIDTTGSITVNNSRFKDDVTVEGKATILNSQFISSQLTCPSNTTIKNSVFTKAKEGRPALYLLSNASIIGCNFTKNKGTALYGSLYLKDLNEITIDGCNFIDNNPKDDNNKTDATIICGNGNFFIYNSNFENNNRLMEIYDGNLTVINSSFSKNSGHIGGAINGCNSTLINSTFTDNSALIAGAIASDILLLENCSFKENIEGAVSIKTKANVNGIEYNGPICLDNSLNIVKLIETSVKKMIKTTTHKSEKSIVLTYAYISTKNPLKKYKTNIKIVENGDVYYRSARTNSKGELIYDVSELDVGKHELTFNYEDPYLDPITVNVSITKAKTIVKAPKVTNQYKKSKYFKISVINKASKKPVKYTYVKLKIGKKTVKVETNKKGIAKFNTKNLKVGKYKVKIASADSNYKIAGKSKITIER